MMQSSSCAVARLRLRRSSSTLAGPLSSRATIVTSTAGAVRLAGFGLLPTYAAPHYDLLLSSAEYREAEALLAVFGSAEPNPFRRRRR